MLSFVSFVCRLWPSSLCKPTRSMFTTRVLTAPRLRLRHATPKHRSSQTTSKVRLWKKSIQVSRTSRTKQSRDARQDTAYLECSLPHRQHTRCQTGLLGHPYFVPHRVPPTSRRTWGTSGVGVGEVRWGWGWGDADGGAGVEILNLKAGSSGKSQSKVHQNYIVLRLFENWGGW